MFKKALKKEKVDNGLFPIKKVDSKPPMLQTSDWERSDGNCHFKSDNYILIPRMSMPEN